MRITETTSSGFFMTPDRKIMSRFNCSLHSNELEKSCPYNIDHFLSKRSLNTGAVQRFQCIFPRGYSCCGQHLQDGRWWNVFSVIELQGFVDSSIDRLLAALQLPV